MRVLIADDESIIRLDLRESLQALGHDVVAEAATGEQAVALAREHAPDAVLLDVRMPGAGGLAAARDIAALGIAPVVLLTAFGGKEIASEAAHAGVFGYVVKPFRVAELEPALETAVARFRDARSLACEADALRAGARERQVVDEAKAALMKRHGLSEAEAYALLRRRAMDRRERIAEAARRTLAGR